MTLNPQNLQIRKPDKKLQEKLEKVSIKEKVLFEIQSDFHDIKVVENNFGKFIKFCDTYQAGYVNSPYYQGNLFYINYFLIPYLMNKNIKNILLIGLGSGIIINQFEKIFDKLKNIDIVDIEENMLSIAKKYFNFKQSQITNFYLQDALIYLKTNKKKYDLIIADVADNVGLDERFCQDEYLNLINSRLKKDGIFVSNLPSSRDIFNKKNYEIIELIEKYKNIFKHINIFNGETSNKLYYKVFYDIDEVVYDITNLILISSNKYYNLSNDFEKFKKIKVDIQPYLNDKIK